MRVAHSSDTALCRGIVRGQFRVTGSASGRVTAGGSSIYGVLVYSWDDDARDGVYEITKSGAILKFARPDAYAMTAGWLKGRQTMWLCRGQIWHDGARTHL